MINRVISNDNIMCSTSVMNSICQRIVDIIIDNPSVVSSEVKDPSSVTAVNRD